MSKVTGVVFKSRDYIGSVEPSATILEDESRYGNDGTFKADGEPDWIRLPSGLWVMSFDGDDYVDCGENENFRLLNEVSIEAWVKLLASPGTEGFVVGKNYNYYLVVNNTDHPEFVYRRKGVAETLTVAFLGTISIGEWAHVVAVHSYPGYYQRFYLNGSLDREYTEVVHQMENTLLLKNFSLGAAHTGDAGWGTYTTAYISLPKVYNYPLSAGKIKQVFEAERPLFGV